MPKQSVKQNILIIYRGLDVGGIETFIVRLVNFLCQQIDTQVVVATRYGSLIDLIDNRVRFAELPTNLHHRQSCDVLVKAILSENNWIILSFDPFSRFLTDLIIQTSLRKKNSLTIKHLTGCFHPRAYFHEVERKIHHLLNKFVANRLGNDNIYFMNDACRQTHQFFLSRSVNNWPVIALPTKISSESWMPNKKQTLSIISVGRIVQFKAYNFGLVDLALKFRLCKIDATITIYGHGEQSEKLKKIISFHDLSSIVKFDGSLEYSLFENEVKKYDLFIGMGTAAMEAAGLGIPTIVTIDSDKENCYGYIQELPLGAVGEVLDNSPRIRLEDAILHYLNLSTEQRIKIGNEGKKHVSILSESRFWLSIIDFSKNVTKSNKSLKQFSLLTLYFLLIQDIHKIYKVFMMKFSFGTK